MATWDRTNNQSAASLNTASQDYGRRSLILETVIDFGATGNAYSSADVFKIFQVPPGYVLSDSGLEVLTADTAGNSGTLQLELGASTRGSAVTVASNGYSSSAYNTTVAAPSGTVAYVQVLTATGTVNAVVRFFCTLKDVRGKPGTAVCVGGGPGNYVGPWTYTFGAEVT